MKTFEEKNGEVVQMEIPVEMNNRESPQVVVRHSAKSDLGRMKELEVGLQVSFPIAKMFTIRANAANINLQRGFKSLRTSTNKEAKTITVHRIA